MSLLPAENGRIGMGDKWQWFLDGTDLEDRQKLELKIGGHWILGTLIKYKNDLLWCSWLEGVAVPITYFLIARWPEKA